MVLTAALLLGGGTVQALWTDRLLQLLMLPALFWGLGGIVHSRAASGAKLFVGLVLVVLVMQFVPLYREGELFGGQLIGGGWGFFTPMPGASLNSALYATAILGFALYLTRFSDRDLQRLLRFVLVGFFIHLVTAIVQLSFDQRAVLTGFWPFELRAGLFTNENHFGTLIFAVIPLIAWFYLVRVRRTGIYLFVVFLIIAFQFANGSRAGMGISIGLSIICLLWLRAPGIAFAFKLVSLIAAVMGVLALIWLLFPLDELQADARWQYLPTMMSAIRNNWLLGSGLGSFVTTYPIYEAREAITNTYVNHAHNDWLEIALELGLAGALLIFFFFFLVLRNAGRTSFSEAAFLSILAIAVHSLVDYPLRTMGIAVPFAYMTAILLAAKPYRSDTIRDPLDALKSTGSLPDEVDLPFERFIRTRSHSPVTGIKSVN